MKQISAIPDLPIPTLEQTLSLYLSRIKPLLSEETFKEQEQVAKKFLTHTTLDSQLLKYASEIHGSWLKPTWDKSYLDYRDELNSGMNYGTVLKLPLEVQGRSHFYGLIVTALARIFKEISENDLPADQIKNRPLSMEQYQNIFAACRIPMAGQDRLRIAGPRDRHHIIVLYQQNMYVVDIDLENLDLNPIISQLDLILNQNHEPQPNIGIMTTAKREDAAKIRQSLMDHDFQNSLNFETIETALFALCIDEAEPMSEAKHVHRVLHGQSKNRFFDKSVQVIAGHDYTVGFNNEHTGFDGSVWINILHKMCRQLDDLQKIKPISQKAEIRRLQWQLPEGLSQVLEELKKKDRLRGEELEITLLDFDPFGTKTIKGCQTSPDAFFHLALQLAWYRMHGSLTSTYEAVAMRHFFQGRTECMRPCTSEVLNFVQFFEKGSKTDLSKAGELARTALEKHVAGLKECQAGQGPERHLTGMQAMINENTSEVETALFKSEGYRRLKHDTLSTSGLSFEPMMAFAFAPVVNDGFGIGYNLGPDKLSVCLTSFGQKEALLRLKNELALAMEDLKQLLTGVIEQEKSMSA